MDTRNERLRSRRKRLWVHLDPQEADLLEKLANYWGDDNFGPASKSSVLCTALRAVAAVEGISPIALDSSEAAWRARKREKMDANVSRLVAKLDAAKRVAEEEARAAQGNSRRKRTPES
jgi:hypothetical protein